MRERQHARKDSMRERTACAKRQHALKNSAGMGIRMNFGEKSAKRKKIKDLRGELKQMKKEMLAAGCDKNQVNSQLKELEDTLESANRLCTEYTDAKTHLEQARTIILKLLDCMSESPANEVAESLKELISDLDSVYHDCSIRQDDLDFQSTIVCLKGLVSQFGAASDVMSAIMLRSELENIKSVLDDTSAWNAPDFFALAYFYRHEDSSKLRDIENEQRNTYVLNYLEQNFMQSLKEEAGRAAQEEKLLELMQAYIHD